MTVEQILEELRQKAIDAAVDLEQAEADGELMFDAPYHEARLETLETIIGWIEHELELEKI